MNGKAKGGAFERVICKQLSLWVSGGKATDLFWRSAVSGGRATVHHRKGTVVRQGGDICAVAPEGHVLTSKYFIECKHLKHIGLGEFMVKGTGPLKKIWAKLLVEAERHKLDPMLIARQNMWPTLVITKPNHVAHWSPSLIQFHGLTARSQQFDVIPFEALLASPFEGHP